MSKLDFIQKCVLSYMHHYGHLPTQQHIEEYARLFEAIVQEAS